MAAAVAEAWEERTVHPRVGVGAVVSCAVEVRPRKDEVPLRPLSSPPPLSPAGMESTEFIIVLSLPDPP